MASLSLKISVAEKNLIKTMQFDPAIVVYDACRVIRDKILEANLGQAKDYGLFLTDEDPKKGVWLEPGRALEYYLLRNGDLLEYKRKMRTLRVRMLDGTVKTVLVDDSQPVANLMVVICTKIGITNHDEYSLVREFPEETKDGGYSSGTLTLRRKDKDKTLDSKMEQLKKKLRTDDDLDWVDHSRTLREQGIDEEETLLLRRKFFFSDQNIDSRDPVQLNLLYVQARDAIIAGTHPVTVEEACQFGGLQSQIQFGDHVENKHKPGFLDLKEFLPKDYVKNKGIEKKTFLEHRKHIGLTELEAKVKYVHLARSLKTYGVTFFLVKEKMKDKNKLVPRLLGVTKESVLRLDEKTKEILKTWPLTTVKRWAASPNSFTLDFGDYSDSYYSVQTNEGEQISQLIAGYIDIILKRKKAKDHFGIEGDDGSTMVEESVSPYKATILQHQPAHKPSHPSMGNIAMPAVMRAGTDGAQTFSTGQMPQTQLTAVKGQAHVGHSPGVSTQHPLHHSTQMTEPQRALLSTIDSSREAIKRAEKDLQTREKYPEGNEQWKQSQLDVKRQNVSSQLTALNAATAQIITLTSVPEEQMDHPALGAAVATITTNMPDMSMDVKVIAALMEDDDKGDRLIEATRSLCSAFSNLLKAAEPGTRVPRQNLLNAACSVGEATHALLYTIGEEDEYDRETSDILLSLAKAVANAAAALVLRAKDVASKCDDEYSQNKVISSATQCALATSQLVACAKVVAPTIQNPTCQRQLTQSSREVAKAVETVVVVTNESSTDEKLINQLKMAAAAVTQALNELLTAVKHHVGHSPAVSTQHPWHYSSQITEPQRVLLSTIDTSRDAIKRAEKDLQTRDKLPDLGNESLQWKQTQYDVRKQQVSSYMSAMNAATAQIITLTSVPEEQMDHPALGAAVDTITSNMPDMSKDVKVIASLMEDDKGDRLLEATRSLCSAFSDLLKAAEPGTRVPRQNLLNAACSVGEATQSLLCTVSIGDEDEFARETSDTLLTLAKAFANAAATLVLRAKDVASKCENENIQNRVISSANQCALATSQLVACAKVVAPTIHNPTCQRQLTQSSKEVSKAVETVLIITSESSTDERMINQTKVAAAAVKQTLNDLLTAVKSQGQVSTERQIHHSSAQIYLQNQNSIDRSVGRGDEGAVEAIFLATDRLFSSQGDAAEMVRQAKVLVKAMGQLIKDIKYQAETQSNPEIQKRLLTAARSLADATARLVKAAKACATNPNDTEAQAALKSAAEDLRNATNLAASNALRKKVISSLQMSEKHSSAMAMQSVPGAHRCPETKNQVIQEELIEICKEVSHKVVQGTKRAETEKIEKQAIGDGACLNAASTVSGIIGDLDTTIMFATAGTLNPENENENFADHRENILKTAKALVEDTKTLVAGAASSQEQLAVAAQNAVMTIVQLSEVVKLGAAFLGSTNAEIQVMLINAVKDVATALEELIHATKAASGKSVNDPAMIYLKEAAKVMVTNVTTLLKTLKTVEDEHQRGTRALEATIEAIGQEVRAFDSPDVPNRKASPEDMIRVMKPVTLATAKAVAAGTSGKQDDVIVAANMGRKAIFDLLITSKQAAYAAETVDLRLKVMEAGRSCAMHYRELLVMVHRVIQRPTGATSEEKQHLVAMSRTVATSVTEIVSSVEMLKGSDWVDPDDPTVIAETELLGAASSIEAAAKKLACLQPRRTSIKLPHEEMNFDEIILEAAKSITAATAALVRAACAAQRELVVSGRVSSRPVYTSDDGQWSDGLISAARHVAAATHSLVEAANALVQGQASEEKLISSAKQVASSTAQLLVACKVKADPDAQSTKRLQAAGNAVIKATDNLVTAAQQAIEHEEEQSLVISKRRVSGIAQEIVAREAILKKERELDEARDKLTAIRRAKYGHTKKEEYHSYEYHSTQNYQSTQQAYEASS